MKYYFSAERVALIVDESKNKLLVKSRIVPSNKVNKSYYRPIWVDKVEFKKAYKR